MKLAIIHRGSQTARQITEGVGIKRWGRRVQADVIVNYGLAGSRFEDWKGRNPVGKLKRMINRPHGLNKYEVVMKAEDWGVRVPETRTSLDLRHNGEGWLEKPFYSQAGRGIEEIISGFISSNTSTNVFMNSEFILSVGCLLMNGRCRRESGMLMK